MQETLRVSIVDVHDEQATAPKFRSILDQLHVPCTLEETFSAPRCFWKKID